MVLAFGRRSNVLGDGALGPLFAKEFNMTYSEAFCLAAERTNKTKLIHIVREVNQGNYCVFMTGEKSALYA